MSITSIAQSGRSRPDVLSMLVTGASGFVGRAFCEEAIRRGYRVRAAVREPADFYLPGCEATHVPNIGPETDWSEALHGCDTVIHLASRVHVMHDVATDPLAEFRKVNVEGTERLARSAVARGIKRFVFVSSIKVNGEATGEDDRFDGDSLPCPQDPYGVSKFEAEQALRQVAVETGLEVVILRPPLVYGAAVKGNFIQMLGVLGKRVPLPLASVHNRRSLLYVGNLVDALITCATHPAAAGRHYLLCDDEDISTPELLRRLGAGMGRPARLFPCPVFLLRLAGKLVGKAAQVDRLIGSLRVDNGKIRQELDWIPPHTSQQGLRVTAEWYRNTHL